MNKAHQQSFTLARYYREKYGTHAIEKLEKDAEYCNQENDLHRRNRLLRVRDEILLDQQYSHN
ncbi:MAG: hypothetical protein JKX94_08380 [Sneathiella sp.]|nr:hypothetical protein [Sneathiella sp.]